MKRLLLAALLLGNMAQAASTATLLLSGTVQEIMEISVEPSANATNLNISGGEIAKQVAIATETSNSLSGYKISLRSLNASRLVHTANSSKSTSYTISYNGGSYISLSNVDQVVKSVNSLSGLATQTSDIKVNVLAYVGAPAGTYSDIVTISISAN